MLDLVDTLKLRFEEALKSAYGNGSDSYEVAISPASNPQFGDYQTNLALTLSKQLKQPPRAIAEAVIGKVDLKDICEKPEIAGPGFINLKVATSYWEEKINAIKSDPRLGIAKAKHPRKVIVELSSPNMAKEMHVGHVRTTIIGDCLARVYEFAGHDVTRLNHVGDWGTQFGMLVAYLREVCPDALTKPDAISLGDLVSFYRQAKKRFDADAEFQNISRQEVVKLQGGDPDTLRAWKYLLEQSRHEAQIVYDLLDVHNLIERGESFYNEQLPEVVRDLQKAGLCVEDQGAKCVFLEGYKNEQGGPLPLIIQKSDGGYNYATSDLAALRYRVTVERAEEILYVVAADQADHLGPVYQVARRAGWVPDNVRIEHVQFGVVQGEDGKKLKTRAGETIRLKDLLQEGMDRARAELESRLAQEGRTESEEYKQQMARAIGIGAVKYFDLSLNRITNYVFNFDKMLSLSGNTAPYMMYAYVRIRGIERKGEIDFSKLPASAKVILGEPVELDLAKQLLAFDEMIETVTRDLLPNRICEYLFELSQKFNQFYEKAQVLSAPEPVRTSRLILCHLTAEAIKTGLSLLGISVLEKM
jgi:arginyl-tRNA synthetase